MDYNNSRITNLIEYIWQISGANDKTNPIEIIEQIGCLLLVKHLEQVKPDKRQTAMPYDWARLLESSSTAWLQQDYNSVYAQTISYYQAIYGFEKENIYDNTLKAPHNLSDLIHTLDHLFGMLSEGNELTGSAESIVFELLLRKTARLGAKGQFRTPRHIVHFMTELADPESNETVFDPACGTGGFLLSAKRHIEVGQNADTQQLIIDADGFCHVKENTASLVEPPRLEGADNDKAMVRIGIINMILHGVENFHIRYKNSLQEDFTDAAPKYDVIISNPPFGIKDRESHPYSRYGFTTSELQFLEKSLDALKPHGRAVIIVPEGILSNSNAQYRRARQMLLDSNCCLDAVISLPSGAFKPYTTGKSAILVLQKGKPTHEVWFYELESDGYTQNKDRRRTKGEPLIEAVKNFKNRHTSADDYTKSYFFVSLEEIAAHDWNLNFNSYKKLEYVEQHVTEPKQLIEMLLEEEKNILKELHNLADSIR